MGTCSKLWRGLRRKGLWHSHLGRFEQFKLCSKWGNTKSTTEARGSRFLLGCFSSHPVWRYKTCNRGYKPCNQSEKVSWGWLCPVSRRGQGKFAAETKMPAGNRHQRARRGSGDPHAPPRAANPIAVGASRPPP